MDEQLETRINKTNEFFAKYGEKLSPRERDLIRLRFGMDDGRFRTIEELSELFGTKQEDVENSIQSGIEKMNISILGYYQLIYCIFGGGDIPPLYKFNYVELKEKLDSVLELVDEKERKVLQLRAGLFDNKQYSLRAIGEMLGVTGERIRQIEGKALRKLRHPNRSKKLYEYMHNLENN